MAPKKISGSCSRLAVTMLPSASTRSEEHTSELQSHSDLVCRLLLERVADHPHLHSFPTRRSSDLKIFPILFEGKQHGAMLDRTVVGQIERGLHDHAQSAVAADGAEEDFRLLLPAGGHDAAVRQHEIGRAHV